MTGNPNQSTGRLAGRRIALGVTGSIAAYKSVELLRLLQAEGADVRVLMTAAAVEFVGKLTLETLSRHPVDADVLALQSDGKIGHIETAHDVDVIVVAPATAHWLGAMANGLASDPITAACLAASVPVVVAPAMDGGMYGHAATQANLARLREFGYRILEPEEGVLASGMTGKGRLAGLDRIVDATVEALSGARPAAPAVPAEAPAGAAIEAAAPAPKPAAVELARPAAPARPAAQEPQETAAAQPMPKPYGPTDLSGLHVVVTAGGTAEPIDPVRFVGNRSSGKMGIAIAQAALDRGAAVTVILGNASVEPPAQAHVARAETAAEMQAALRALTPPAGPLFDVLVMAAAVADFRPRTAADHKLARSEGLALELEPTPDLLAETADRVRTGIRASGLARPVLVGFAAETGSFKRAAEKLKAKGVDLLVANDVSEPGSGFGTDTNRVTIYSIDEPPEELPLMTKREVAEALLSRVAVRLKLDSSSNGADLDLPTTFPSGLSHKAPVKPEPAEIDR